MLINYMVQLRAGTLSNANGELARSLLLWRYSRPAWTRSCAAYCRWPCFGRGVGL